MLANKLLSFAVMIAQPQRIAYATVSVAPTKTNRQLSNRLTTWCRNLQTPQQFSQNSRTNSTHSTIGTRMWRARIRPQRCLRRCQEARSRYSPTGDGVADSSLTSCRTRLLVSFTMSLTPAVLMTQSGTLAVAFLSRTSLQ